jgi:hypothetical protein
MEEKRKAIRKLQEDYLHRIDAIKSNYRFEIQKIMKAIEARKLEEVRVKLRSKTS